MTALVNNPDDIRLAMVGMLSDNHHPFSWSAIVNGAYDREQMSLHADPVITGYLGRQPDDALGVPGAKVTHIWADRDEDAHKVARSALIPNIVSRPEDVIGSVDAVLIPTDLGGEHLERSRPFIEAGLPVFIDKPLTDNAEDLDQFEQWYAQGKPFMSCSALRYSLEYADMRDRASDIGDLRLITITMVKSWERYGIHALEGVYPFLRPGGWVDVTHTGDEASRVIHLRHRDGVSVVIAMVDDLYPSMGHLTIHGTAGNMSAKFSDSFNAFKSQLSAFVQYLRTGVPPFGFDQTLELMKMIVATKTSREQGGRTVELCELSQLMHTGD